MTTITAKISNEKDVKVLKEILERFGISYVVNESSEDYKLSKAQIADFKKTQKEFLEGKSTAKTWDDIKKELNSVYS